MNSSEVRGVARVRFPLVSVYVAEVHHFVFLCVSLDTFAVLFDLFVLGLVFLIPGQETGWEKRLRNDLFCTELDVKPQLSQFSLADVVLCDCVSL